ncbi:hypothetical protein FNX44_028000, partial [Streptomyces sp. OF1]|nr:hypothetical protein [Streptomyces alkaliterrae]
HAAPAHAAPAAGGHAAHASHGGHTGAAHATDAAGGLDAGGTFGQFLGGHSSVGMLAAHLLAAALCGLWLWRGETALFRLLRLLRTLALPPLALDPTPVLLPEPVRISRPAREDHTVPLWDALLAHFLIRRGPP